jgi:hypothetical protein
LPEATAPFAVNLLIFIAISDHFWEKISRARFVFAKTHHKNATRAIQVAIWRNRIEDMRTPIYQYSKSAFISAPFGRHCALTGQLAQALQNLLCTTSAHKQSIFNKRRMNRHERTKIKPAGFFQQISHHLAPDLVCVFPHLCYVV